MTRYNKEEREKMKEQLVDQKIIDLEYDDISDCFVMVFEDNSEMCFRFMADLIKRGE